MDFGLGFLFLSSCFSCLFCMLYILLFGLVQTRPWYPSCMPVFDNTLCVCNCKRNLFIYKQQPPFGAKKIWSDDYPQTLSFPGANSFPRAYNCEYPSIFSRQMEAVVFVILLIFFATFAFLKTDEISQFFLRHIQSCNFFTTSGAGSERKYWIDSKT